MLINGYLLYNRVIKNEVGMSVMNLSKIIESAKEVFEIEANSILRLKDNIGEEFDRAIDILYNCKGRVIVTGMGKSGLIGKKIAATMSSTGTPAYFLHPAESTHGDSGVITRNDVIIAISNSGETQELMNLLPLIKRFGCEMIGMTGNLNSTLAKTSEVVLDISVEKEADTLGKAPTASTTATLAMGDALAVCLMEKKGFTKEDFLMFHPSGKLGKGLTYKVKDLQDVIKTISEYKLGMAMIVDTSGHLAGVLTDGDIRRTIIKHSNTTDLSVKDVMTVNPKRITEDAYAASALNLMEKYSITALAVVDENNTPTGVIHVHDLLRAGVA